MAKPLRRIHLNPNHAPLPDASAVPDLGMRLVAALGFDVRVGRVSSISRRADGGFAVATSCPPLDHGAGGELWSALGHVAFGPLSPWEAQAAGLPSEPADIADLGALLLMLFAAAQERSVYVAFDHRPHEADDRRFRVVFAHGTNDAVRAPSAQGALREGLAALSGRPEPQSPRRP